MYMHVCTYGRSAWGGCIDQWLRPMSDTGADKGSKFAMANANVFAFQIVQNLYADVQNTYRNNTKILPTVSAWQTPKVLFFSLGICA